MMLVHDRYKLITQKDGSLSLVADFADGQAPHTIAVPSEHAPSFLAFLRGASALCDVLLQPGKHRYEVPSGS